MDERLTSDRNQHLQCLWQSGSGIVSKTFLHIKFQTLGNATPHKDLLKL